ncbi:hypothetical protein BST61_g136 [Cercospora zeina]
MAGPAKKKEKKNKPDQPRARQTGQASPTTAPLIITRQQSLAIRHISSEIPPPGESTYHVLGTSVVRLSG